LNAAYFIQTLNLQKHPEGGWFKETYRSDEVILQNHLPGRFSGNRNFSTAIYFLLDGKSFSAFHRIKSDELWHFYYGRGINVYIIHPTRASEIIRLGQNLDAGQQMQAVVKAGCWFASEVIDSNSFSLAGCTVAPGFDFADFELAKRNELIELFPEHENWIVKFCRQ
jgi:uncharacterized protein